jgi:acetoin utilization deacetylase AcuC-like enzyme
VGRTINLPLPRGTDGQEYLRVLGRDVIPELIAFAPEAIVISAGFDTYELDPIGAFSLKTPDFAEVGALFGRLKIPTVVVQEGGYCTEALGQNVVALLRGLESSFR